MRTYERFMNYVKVHTSSSETTGTHPSTPWQFDLANILAEEMKELGLSDVKVSEFGVVTGVLPATEGLEHLPGLGILAHMDTIPEFSGENVEPLLWENYDGSDIVLPKCDRVITNEAFPFLKDLVGKTVITASGDTVLGADDKAGVAEIMTLCEQLIEEKIPHGKLCIGFTPDEEIGEGVAKFDVEDFGAAYAYTVDGNLPNAVEFENFNAASAFIKITGVSVHPGSAKNMMENAVMIAMEINNALPADEVPEKTEGYEGFYHLMTVNGAVDYAEMDYIIRDHSRESFEQRKATIQRVVEDVQKAHPKAHIELILKDSYYNMVEKLTDCMHLVDNAKKAIAMAGLTPVESAIRGGTDGAKLSFMGLPCPNLGTGGYNFHGPFELVASEDMDTVVEILKNIVKIYAEA